MRHARSIAFWLIAMAVFVCPFAAAAETGVTDSTIRIGIVADMTGPPAWIGRGVRDGFSIFVDEFNARGGVNGRKIELHIGDIAGSGSKGILAVKKLIEVDKVFMLYGGGSSAGTVPTIPVIVENNVPFFVSVTASPALTKPLKPMIFRSPAVPDDITAHAMVDFALEAKKAKTPAILYMSDELGKSGLAEATKRMKHHNATWAAEEAFNLGDTNFTSQLLRLKSKNVDGLILYGYVKELSIILRQAKELGLKSTIVMSPHNGGSILQRTAKEYAVGAYAAWYVGPDADYPTSPAMRSLIDKYRARFPNYPPGIPNTADIEAYAAGFVLEEAFKRAGKDLTRENVVKALEGIKEFGGSGLIFPTTFSATERQGNKTVKFYEIMSEDQVKFVDFQYTGNQ